MAIEKLSEEYNPLIKRTELKFQIDHQLSGTPRLLEIRKGLASMYKVDQNLVYVTKIKTLRGTNRSIGKAEVYENKDKAKQIVPKYIQKRNLLEKEEKKEK
jgi:ribosomal protein S24E